MPKINLRELRDTRQLKAWLRSGKTVELNDRNRLLACIVPEPAHAGPAGGPTLRAFFAKSGIHDSRVSHPSQEREGWGTRRFVALCAVAKTNEWLWRAHPIRLIHCRNTRIKKEA